MKINFNHKSPRLRVLDKTHFIMKVIYEKDILHLGATDKGSIIGHVLHKTMMTIAKSVIGLDIDRDGIEKAKKEGIQNIFYCNVENIGDIKMSSFRKEFDIILAGEIIEHLSNPGLFLENIKGFFSSKTEMIITTPNALCLHRYIYTFFTGYERVHPEHMCYFSYNTLKELLVRHGFIIKETYYYTLGNNIEKMIYKIFPNLCTGLIFVISLYEPENKRDDCENENK